METKTADLTISFNHFSDAAWSTIAIGIKSNFPDAKFKKIEETDRLGEAHVVYEVFLHGE